MAATFALAASFALAAGPPASAQAPPACGGAWVFPGNTCNFDFLVGGSPWDITVEGTATAFPIAVVLVEARDRLTGTVVASCAAFGLGTASCNDAELNHASYRLFDCEVSGVMSGTYECDVQPSL